MNKIPLFLSSFFIDLIQRIKNTLGSIRNYTQISRGKFSDKEFGEYFYRAVTEDIEKIDMVLNGLVNYIKLNTPIRKTDTVHHLIEEVLKKHQAKLEEKGVKLFKKFEKDLPETIVPDEQLKIHLKFCFSICLGSISSQFEHGSFTPDPFALEKEVSRGPCLCSRRMDDTLRSRWFLWVIKNRRNKEWGLPKLQKEEPLDLILRFVKEVVQRNRGIMRIEADEKKDKDIYLLEIPC